MWVEISNDLQLQLRSHRRIGETVEECLARLIETSYDELKEELEQKAAQS